MSIEFNILCFLLTFRTSNLIETCLCCSMDFGVWTENSRGTYNKWDGVARCTTQVTGPSNLLYRGKKAEMV